MAVDAQWYRAGGAKDETQGLTPRAFLSLQSLSKTERDFACLSDIIANEVIDNGTTSTENPDCSLS